jgi:hypothetical protein
MTHFVSVNLFLTNLLGQLLLKFALPGTGAVFLAVHGSLRIAKSSTVFIFLTIYPLLPLAV